MNAASRAVGEFARIVSRPTSASVVRAAAGVRRASARRTLCVSQRTRRLWQAGIARRPVYAAPLEGVHCPSVGAHRASVRRAVCVTRRVPRLRPAHTEHHGACIATPAGVQCASPGVRRAPGDVQLSAARRALRAGLRAACNGGRAMCVRPRAPCISGRGLCRRPSRTIICPARRACSQAPALSSRSADLISFAPRADVPKLPVDFGSKRTYLEHLAGRLAGLRDRVTALVRAPDPGGQRVGNDCAG